MSTRRRDLAHLLAINDVRVTFVVACRAHADIFLELFLADPDLRRHAGTPAPTYIPDALVRIRTPAGELGLVVEIDLGVESATYFASSKGWTLPALARCARVATRCRGAGARVVRD